jgi:hypothetical protein
MFEWTANLKKLLVILLLIGGELQQPNQMRPATQTSIELVNDQRSCESRFRGRANGSCRKTLTSGIRYSCRETDLASLSDA